MPAQRDPDILCLSDARWESGHVRVQQLMRRFGVRRRVFFLEEPAWGEGLAPRLGMTQVSEGVTVVVPQVPRGFDRTTTDIAEGLLLQRLLREQRVQEPVLWWATPRPVNGLRGLKMAASVCDRTTCSPVRDVAGAESRHLRRADLVFAAGQGIWRETRALHPRVYLFPSPIDEAHFRQAELLRGQAEPALQAHLPRPRLGYLGRIDARLDLDLLAALSRQRPRWQIVLLGPVVGVPEHRLPRAANLHYLGPQPYDSLPAFMAAWDVALVPFAQGAATRFVHPAKVSAYLAAGCVVVSTPVPDVLETHGRTEAVRIARTPQGFIDRIEEALEGGDAGWAVPLDGSERTLSWDETWRRMDRLLAEVLATKQRGRACGPATLTSSQRQLPARRSPLPPA